MFLFRNVKKCTEFIKCRQYLRITTLRKLHNYSVKHLMNGDEHINTRVVVKGWVKSIRSHTGVTFIHVNDGSCAESIQVVSSTQLPSEATYGACIHVEGELVPSLGKNQKVEVKAESIDVTGTCDPVDFPFKLRERHPADYTRQFLHLRPRTKTFSSLLRIRSEAAAAIHQYFQSEDFCQIHTPILTSNDCETAGETFIVEPADSERLKSPDDEAPRKHFFNTPANLTVSGQFHLEAMTGALHKVYTFGPTFRAENSHTRHHLSEFMMVEAEIAFTENTEDLMTVIEGCLQHTTKHLLDKCASDLHVFTSNSTNAEQEKIIQKMSDSAYVRLSYDEAVAILEKSNSDFKTPVQWGNDLQKEHEQHLVRHCSSSPVFVTDYPAPIKPFYARENPDGKTVAGIDLLCANVGEVVGGTLREERYDILKAKTDSLGLTESLDWYLSLRKYGSCPHGGFGIGFERVLQCLLGINNIKDTTAFPRYAGSCKM